MSIQESYIIDDKTFTEFYSDIRKNTLKEFVPVENGDETAALNKLKGLPDSIFIKLLEKIYDKSRIAGKHIVKYKGDTLTTDHIISFLNKTDIPCLSSGWNLLDDESTYRRFRTSCPNTVCNRQCTYWREAVKGLVEGLGESTKYARHRSIGHGDNICVDVIYDSENSDLKFGLISDEIEELIKPVRAELAKNQIKLILEGFSEGFLYYRLVDMDCKPDTFRYNFAKDFLIEKFREKLPKVVLFEINTL
jgi:hypothetical protein